HMKEAADLGSTQAPYYLGSWYRNGVGTEKDLEQADHWLAQDDSVKALIQRMLVKEELGDRQAALDLAKDAMAKTSSAKTRGMLQKKLDVWDEPSAEPAYLKAAGEYNAKEAVSAPKQVSARDLMNMAKGYADVNDFRQERRALEEAARLSHPEANYKLGAYLASGMHENETDPKAAFQWMMHAADLGNSQAPYYLGMWYAGGTGIEQDLEQAAFWLAKDESPKAKMQLALVLKQLEREEEAERTLQEILDAPEGQGTKAARDLAGRKLRQWRAEREKKQEQTQAQTRKSLRIAHVLNDAGEYDLAAEFLEQAAAGGSMEAKYLLALLLVKGQGVAADPERAKTLLEQTKDTRPESLYYLTYLESDPEKKEAYARAYLAGNPEKTRKAQVEKLLGIEEPET
ncbi:tetratricopeptide repeat protein, partial [Faecalibaculum rodentium]